MSTPTVTGIEFAAHQEANDPSDCAKKLLAAKRAIHAAHGLLAPLGSQPTPSLLAIRETLAILRGQL